MAVESLDTFDYEWCCWNIWPCLWLVIWLPLLLLLESRKDSRTSDALSIGSELGCFAIMIIIVQSSIGGHSPLLDRLSEANLPQSGRQWSFFHLGSGALIFLAIVDYSYITPRIATLTLDRRHHRSGVWCQGRVGVERECEEGLERRFMGCWGFVRRYV